MRVPAEHRDEPDPAPLVPRGGEWTRRTVLRDGTPVLIRQIRPSDRERLSEGLRRLSPGSRYLRFHAEIDELTNEQLDYLTRVDHHDHEALVALDADKPDVPGIGVARYIRDADRPEVAEAAITVADEYHGQGAGTLLLGALAARARTCGVRIFRNYVLGHNQAMLEVFDNLGATREPEAPGLWRVDLEVPRGEAELPSSSAGRAFAAAARDDLRLTSMFPPVWGGRRSDSGRVDAGDADDAGIESEVAALDDDLDRWLADRERRRVRWPGDLGGDGDGGHDHGRDGDDTRDGPDGGGGPADG